MMSSRKTQEGQVLAGTMLGYFLGTDKHLGKSVSEIYLSSQFQRLTVSEVSVHHSGNDTAV